MPEYVVLGGSFRTRGGVMAGEYTGRVIGSRDAFYIVIYLTPAQLSGMSVGGGLLGAVGAALSQGDAIKSEVTDVSKLPESVRTHPDWPFKEGKDYKVVVVPRAAVKKIRYSWWKTFDIVTEEQSFYVGLWLFGRGKKLKFLRDAGWQF